MSTHQKGCSFPLFVFHIGGFEVPNLDLEMFTSFSKLAKGGTLLFLHLVMKISRGLHFIFGPKALIIQNNDCTTTATRTTTHLKARNSSPVDNNNESETSGRRNHRK